MRVFLYIVARDGGFAPNPFHGWCSLACCKPAIRRRAKPGDWVVGIAPKRYGHGVVYAMNVEETLTFAQYWTDCRFVRKRPRRGEGASLLERNGDNCYAPTGSDEYTPLPSAHWKGLNRRDDERQMAKDLRGERVLVSRRFSYFGEQPRALPLELSTLVLPARFTRVNFTQRELLGLKRFLERLPHGVRARPRHWREEDHSWREESVSCG
jgi:hypothetical protein